MLISSFKCVGKVFAYLLWKQSETVGVTAIRATTTICVRESVNATPLVRKPGGQWPKYRVCKEACENRTRRAKVLPEDFRGGVRSSVPLRDVFRPYFPAKTRQYVFPTWKTLVYTDEAGGCASSRERKLSRRRVATPANDRGGRKAFFVRSPETRCTRDTYS